HGLAGSHTRNLLPLDARESSDVERTTARGGGRIPTGGRAGGRRRNGPSVRTRADQPARRLEDLGLRLVDLVDPRRAGGGVLRDQRVQASTPDTAADGHP